MKKLLKKLAKKSLALVMAVVMMLSCWVWVAPTPEVLAASETLDYPIDQLYSTYLTTDAINNTGAGFATPQYNGVAVPSSKYANILRSYNYTSDAWTGTISVTSDTARGNCDKKDVYVDWDWHVPTDTAVLVDGTTKPKIPVVLSADPENDDKVTIAGSWPSDGNFALVDLRWYGKRSDAGEIADVEAMYNASGDGLAGSTTDNTNLCYTNNDTAVQSAGSVTVEGGYSGLVSTVKLNFTGITAASGKHPGTTSTSTNGPSITVINYLPLKQALNEAKTYIETAYNDKTKQEYTEESKEELRKVVNQLVAAKPDTTYFNGNSKFNSANYQADAQAAIDAWNTWKTEKKLVRQYNITWNIDGAKTTVKVKQDVVPSYTGATPTRASDNTYDYEFAYWSPTPSGATADVEYTAMFNSIKRSYTVTFLAADGTVIQTGGYGYGDTVTAPNAPSIANKEFKAWSPAFNATVTGNATYTATYEDLYTVTFKNYDDSVIGTSQVKYGQAAKAPANPTKPADADNEYVFDKWDKDFSNVTGNMEVTATFTTKGHDNIQTTVTQQPTCTTGAMVVRYCADCGYQWNGGQPYEDTSVAAPLGHSFEGENPTFIVQRNGAKTETTHTVKCTRCAATTTMPHEFQINQNKPASDANCVTPGEVYEICPDCLYERTVDGGTNPDKHDNVTTEGYVAPKCGVPGYTGDKICLDCNITVEFGEVIEALEHEFLDEDYVSNNDATCTADGTETAVCHLCKDPAATHMRQDVGSQIPHKYTDYVYNNNAACEKNGTETAVCDYGCGTEHTREKEGTALQHDFTGDHKSNNDGTHSFLCKNDCGTYGGTVECTYGPWIEVDDEYHKHTCTLCNYTPDATEHVWGGWTSDDSSATSAGSQTRYCELCGRADNKNCTYTDTYTAPTCEKDAYTTYECPDCGHGYTIVHEDTKTGHNFNGKYNFDTNADKHQQACTNPDCDAYGVGTTKDEWAACEWTYENKEAGKHTATCVCGNSEVQNCSGGQATCTEKAECQFCTEEYGTTSPHSYTGTVVNIETGKHAYLCVYCDDPSHYGVGAEKDKTEDCFGGSATCKDYAVCEKCSEEYGEYAPHTFNGTPVELEGDVHAYRCSVCPDDTIYGVGNEIGKTEDCSGGEATCTDKAVCDICNDTHGDIDPDAHDWTDWVNVDGTNTHSRYCEYDNTHTEVQDCFSASPVVAAPDCNTDGYTLHTCEDCAHTWQTDPVPALGHDWGEWVSDGAGKHTRTCTRNCGYGDNYQTEDCTKEEATAVVTKPTCTADGYTTYTCNDCGYVWTDDTVAALGHNYAEKLINDAHLISAADCENAPVYWYDCSRCNKNAKDEENTDKYTDLTFTYGKALGHKYQNKIDDKYLASEATCFASAKYYTSCERCEKSSEEIKGTGKGDKFSVGTALEHDWKKVEDDKYLATDYDCVNDKTYYYVCSRCGNSSEDFGGETWTKEDSASGHSMTHTAAKAATCTEAGNLEYWYCSNCMKYYKNEEGTQAYAGQSATVIKKLDHQLTKVAYKAPTCEEDGNPAYEYCTREGCGYSTKPATLPDGYKAKGHNFAGAYVCDEANDYHSRLCLNGCGKKGVLVDDKQVEYKVTVEGEVVTIVGGEKCTFTAKTKTENGVHTHEETCVCGNGEVKIYTNTYIGTVEPTCTSKGYDNHQCPDCKETWTANEVPANDHTPSDEAVSNGDGTHSIYCTVEGCGYKISTDKCSGGTATCKDQAVCEVCNEKYGKTSDHSYDETKWVYQEDAKCGINGTEKNTCTVCQTEVTRTAEDTALDHDMSDFGYKLPEKWDAPDFDESTIKAPTCGTEGLSISYCKREGCYHYVTIIVEKTDEGHQWGEPTVSGDCSSGVTLIYTCSACGQKKSEAGDSEHKWEQILYKPATCTANGYIHYQCSVCKFVEKLNEATVDFSTDATSVEFLGMTVDITALKAKGHIWGADVVDKAATCGMSGRGHKNCTVCQAAEEFVIPATGEHNLKDNSGYPATCGNTGLESYQSCTRCSYSETAKVIPALGHTDSNADGKCDSCNDSLSNIEAKEDGCICHKDNGFMKFIYSILKFFWKLFKINETCACGVAHY